MTTTDMAKLAAAFDAMTVTQYQFAAMANDLRRGEVNIRLLGLLRTEAAMLTRAVKDVEAFIATEQGRA